MSIAEDAARDRVALLRNEKCPLVVIDFPTRGVESDDNVPKEIGDSYRKYFALPISDRSQDDDVFFVVRKSSDADGCI